MLKSTSSVLSNARVYQLLWKSKKNQQSVAYLNNPKPSFKTQPNIGPRYGFQVVSDCADAFLLPAKGVSFPCQKENPTPNWLSESGGKRSCQSSRRDESRGGGENEVRLRRIMFASSLMMVANSTVCMCAYFVYVCVSCACICSRTVQHLFPLCSSFGTSLFRHRQQIYAPSSKEKLVRLSVFGFFVICKAFFKGFFFISPQKERLDKTCDAWRCSLPSKKKNPKQQRPMFVLLFGQSVRVKAQFRDLYTNSYISCKTKRVPPRPDSITFWSVERIHLFSTESNSLKRKQSVWCCPLQFSKHFFVWWKNVQRLQ